MLIHTSRFGSVEIQPSDILLFPNGLVAFEKQLHWVLLADGQTESLAWLQSVSDPRTAFPVVSPRRFAPAYQVRVARGQLAPLQFSENDQAYVLTIVGRDADGMTVNLRAPLIINLDRRIGRQVITADDQPVRHPLGVDVPAARRSA